MPGERTASMFSGVKPHSSNLLVLRPERVPQRATCSERSGYGTLTVKGGP
jgi:hypothetical protein